MSLPFSSGWSRWWLAAACGFGLSLVVAAPYAAHHEIGAGDLLYAVFDPVCHQLAGRSFHLWGEPLAVCHRCSGLYLGFLLGVLVWPQLSRAAGRLLAAPRWVLLFFAPMAIDVAVLVNVPASRFLTGLVAAFPVALLALAALAQLAVDAADGASQPPADGRLAVLTNDCPPRPNMSNTLLGGGEM